jgi:hypothetical protein
MRHVSRVGLQGELLNVVPMHPRGNARNDNEELNAFRGFLLAASASVMLWGLILTAVWLVLWRK